MKRPWLLAAVVVLVISNAWVLTQIAINRSGTPDSQIQMTAREAVYYGSGREDSSVTLRLRWQNPAPQYRYVPPIAEPFTSWFDLAKLKETGFDVSLAPESPAASRYYQNQRSREIFVALEYDGPAWQNWLNRGEPGVAFAPQFDSRMTPEQRMQVRRETESRLVAVDAGVDAAALRQKYPDRAHAAILRGLARVVREESPNPYLRGAITSILTESINVPQPLSRVFDGQFSYVPWTYSGEQIKTQPPPYSLTLAIGSRFEPWVASVARTSQ